MSTDRTNAERQRRFRERARADEDDKIITATVRANFARDDYLTIPHGVSREDWAAYIDREAQRRARKDDDQ